MEKWTLIFINYSGPQITQIAVAQDEVAHKISAELSLKLTVGIVAINTSDGTVFYYKEGQQVERL